MDLILGPMFSGKTTALLQRVTRERAAGQRVQIIKSALDTRYHMQHITTHSGDKLPCMTSPRLLPLLSDPLILASTMIAIDESQFFPDLVDFVASAAEVLGKDVLVAGLDGDFKRCVGRGGINPRLMRCTPHPA